MAPLAAVPKESPGKPVGINAVLLGPPGSGKGTQVKQFIIMNAINIFNRLMPPNLLFTTWILIYKIVHYVRIFPPVLF